MLRKHRGAEHKPAAFISLLRNTGELKCFWGVGGGCYSSLGIAETTYTARVSLCVCLYASRFGVAGGGCGDRSLGFE